MSKKEFKAFGNRDQSLLANARRNIVYSSFSFDNLVIEHIKNKNSKITSMIC